MTAPSARCRVCVQADSWVRTWSAADDDLDREQRRGPDGEPDDRRMRRAGSARRRWPRRATITPTIAATQRCRTWAELTSVSGGTRVPPMSGQSGKTSAESVAVTCEPKRRSANVVAAPKAASSVNRWLAPRPPMPRRIAGPDGQEDEQARPGSWPPPGGRSPTPRCSRGGRSRGPATPGSRPARRRRATATGWTAGRDGRGWPGRPGPGSGSR